MFLEQLKISDFKNCTSAELHFSEKINCFIGNNGAGKTNLLDAIYYLSFCKSYFNLLDQQNIRHGCEVFALHGLYLRNGEHDLVSCVQRKAHKKSFKFNKKEYERLADHIGKLPLVMISPYDRDLINEGSDLRRKFIDGVLSQFDPVYLDKLLQYNQIILQRNTLLRQFAETGRYDPALLDLWDAQLSPLGHAIFEKRKAFLETFVPIFRHYYTRVADSSEDVDIQYESSLSTNNLYESLKRTTDRDRQLKFTTYGIHKDELNFLISGYPLKKFGSQGQQKSFVIAVKLAQFDFMRNIMGYKPILLLDDIFDKLDDKRVSSIIQLTGHDNFGQVFITDTQEQRISRLFHETSIDHRIFHVMKGTVTQTEADKQ